VALRSRSPHSMTYQVKDHGGAAKGPRRVARIAANRPRRATPVRLTLVQDQPFKLLVITSSRDELKPGRSLEEAVVGHEWNAEAHGAGRDPPVAVVKFVAERVSDLLAA
jgi:hypothetical protein